MIVVLPIFPLIYNVLSLSGLYVFKLRINIRRWSGLMAWVKGRQSRKIILLGHNAPVDHFSILIVQIVIIQFNPRWKGTYFPRLIACYCTHIWILIDFVVFIRKFNWSISVVCRFPSFTLEVFNSYIVEIYWYFRTIYQVERVHF